jgi:hypothetical protein
MNICHSLAINEKKFFIGELRKLMLVVDQEDGKTNEVSDTLTRMGQIGLKEFTKHSFRVLVDLIPPDDLKMLFREAFG